MKNKAQLRISASNSNGTSDEVRKARAELFARADHNLATVVKQVRKRQAASNRRVVKPPRRRTTAAQGCIKLAAPRDPVPERRL